MKSLMKKRKVRQGQRRKPSEKLSTWTKVKIALSSVRKSNFCNAIHSRTWIHISPAWVQPCNVCMICNRQRMPFWGHVKHNKHLRSFFDKSTGTRTWVVCSVPTVSWAWDNLSYISFYTLKKTHPIYAITIHTASPKFTSHLIEGFCNVAHKQPLFRRSLIFRSFHENLQKL